MGLNTKIVLLSLFFLASSTLATENKITWDSDKFGKFDIFDPEFGHPLRQFLIATKTAPFVLGEYFFKKGKHITQQHGTMMLPGSGSYRTFGAPFDDSNLVTNADALVAKWHDSSIENLVVRTRRRVGVILVLQFKETLKGDRLTKPKFWDKHAAGWTNLGAVERPDGPGKNFFELKTNKQGIAISKKMDKSYPSMGYGLYEMKLPSVKNLRIHGLSTAHSYVALLIDPDTGKAFPYPKTVEELGGLENPIKPHSQCPLALHDMWTATSDDDQDPDNYINGKIDGNSMVEHTTWHPLIDPVYFCTYGHSHGSFPGRFKPAFTHTAHKTTEEVKDAIGNTVDRRQQEAQEGFKCFTLFEESTRDDGEKEWLHWIFVVHMELNNPRRFSARHHTVQIAVFDKDFKKVLAKIQLKNDYGFAGTRTENGVEPLNKEMQAIAGERKAAKKHIAFRQFNLRSKSSECTMKGSKFQIPNGLQGRQEHWEAPINTCSTNRFKVDVNSPRTGLKTCATSGKNMKVDYLNGGSIDSAFTSLNFALGYGSCAWRADVDAGGAGPNLRFYTDPFFSRILDPVDVAVEKGESTKNHMVQEMHPGFSGKIPGGRYEESDFWHGKFVQRDSPNIRKHGNVLEPWMVLGMDN